MRSIETTIIIYLFILDFDKDEAIGPQLKCDADVVTLKVYFRLKNCIK